MRPGQSAGHQLASPRALQGPRGPSGRPPFGHLAFLALDSLDLQPLELDEPIDVLAQEPPGLGTASVLRSECRSMAMSRRSQELHGGGRKSG